MDEPFTPALDTFTLCGGVTPDGKYLARLLVDRQGRAYTADARRPCRVTSSGECWDGMFHRFIEHDGRAFALVEGERGEVSKLDVMLYTITFTDIE